jgi:secreted Zn-dependent insulinase-like peptidase
MLEPQMFAVLRTDKQLGYIASTSVGIHPGPAGALQLRVGVQGNNVSPDVIDYWVEQVLANFTSNLEASFTTDDLDPWIESQVNSLRQLPGSREAETRRFWPVLRDHTECFTRREQQIDYLTNTGFAKIIADMQSTLAKLIGTDKRIKIVSKIFPYATAPIPAMAEASIPGISSTSESMTSWLALNSKAYVVADSTRFYIDSALLNACDANGQTWTPEIPVCYKPSASLVF